MVWGTMVRSAGLCIMDIFTLLLLLGLESVGHTAELPVVRSNCPPDYRRRVETCIMEAQLAPQAGGGVTLVLHKDTIVDLCDRGILRKTIDCLEEIHTRCIHNTSVVQELDRLYSVPKWQQGAQLLCEDTRLFQDNFDCMSRLASSVTTCILMRTHVFRMGLAFTDPTDHASIKDVTCSFAESIFRCLCSPLEGHCPTDLIKRVAGSMRLFLPPLCIADPGGGEADSGGHDITTPDVSNNVTETTKIEVTATTPTDQDNDEVESDVDAEPESAELEQ